MGKVNLGFGMSVPKLLLIAVTLLLAGCSKTHSEMKSGTPGEGLMIFLLLWKARQRLYLRTGLMCITRRSCLLFKVIFNMSTHTPVRSAL